MPGKKQPEQDKRDTKKPTKQKPTKAKQRSDHESIDGSIIDSSNDENELVCYKWSSVISLSYDRDVEPEIYTAEIDK